MTFQNWTMKITTPVLLLASLFAPFPMHGAAAQAPQARAAVLETILEQRATSFPQAEDTNTCDALPPTAAGRVPDTQPLLYLLEDSAAARGRGPLCSLSVHRSEEDDVGDWYNRRLTLHRYAAWAAVAAFPVEIYTGWRLRSPGADPEWVRDTHRATVWVLGSTFAVNTVTGAWNWWDTRKEPEGRGWRTAHAVVMVAADAAMFATARAGQARARGEGGEWHRELAFTTAGLTTIGHLMMLGPFRRD